MKKIVIAKKKDVTNIDELIAEIKKTIEEIENMEVSPKRIENDVLIAMRHIAAAKYLWLHSCEKSEQLFDKMANKCAADAEKIMHLDTDEACELIHEWEHEEEGDDDADDNDEDN